MIRLTVCGSPGAALPPAGPAWIPAAPADPVTAAAKNSITMVTSLMAGHSPQASAAEGFAKSSFHTDWTTRTVRCPKDPPALAGTPSPSTDATPSSSSSPSPADVPRV
ncbi:hypothetical protein [Streptomyces sp. UNOC14_S4]|uniref:hypothetical protein n=1 Tax=Streptomyces sp. UNOC14_S4 TaxID=2872340 RepID=UPI001E64A53E|nr:hypothetical protein [Streptomyces sp. UNOC14_S4]MCC3769169.1 hypothetical protein [Streptomyces sp. UNOC14_S4]